jgi:hypothetical protein
MDYVDALPDMMCLSKALLAERINGDYHFTQEIFDAL